MRSVHERAQLIVSVSRIGGEPRLRRQEVMDAVTVVAALIPLEILEYRREPDRARPELLDVAQLGANTVEAPSLKTKVIWIIERLMNRQLVGIIKSIYEKKVDDLISPIRRRRKRPARRARGLSSRSNRLLHHRCRQTSWHLTRPSPRSSAPPDRDGRTPTSEPRPPSTCQVTSRWSHAARYPGAASQTCEICCSRPRCRCDVQLTAVTLRPEA